MKKYVRHFIILSISIFVGGSAYGQGSSIAGAVASVASGITEWSHRFNSLPALPRPVVEGADLSISYYDPTAPTYSWVAPSNWNPIIMVGFTERINLPSDSGYLDSVRLNFDSMSGDSVGVILDPDSIYLAPGGYSHLDETLFDPSVSSFGEAFVHPEDLDASGIVTVMFPHIPVPQNFHVDIISHLGSSSVLSTFNLRADTEATRVRTADNCHSTFIGINANTGVYETNVIDGNLTPPGYPSPLFSELYVTAFVSAVSSGVSGNQQVPTISVFPNPSSSFIQIQNVVGISTMEILDLLGRSVLSSQLNGSSKLDVSQLQPGRYEAIVHSASGVTTAPVIIQR